MAAAYNIFGRQVQPHVLAILTLASVTAVAAWPRAKSEAKAVAAPAATKDEEFDLEKLIEYVSFRFHVSPWAFGPGQLDDFFGNPNPIVHVEQLLQAIGDSLAPILTSETTPKKTPNRLVV